MEYLQLLRVQFLQVLGIIPQGLEISVSILDLQYMILSLAFMSIRDNCLAFRMQGLGLGFEVFPLNGLWFSVSDEGLCFKFRVQGFWIGFKHNALGLCYRYISLVFMVQGLYKDSSLRIQGLGLGCRHAAFGSLREISMEGSISHSLSNPPKRYLFKNPKSNLST